MGKIYWDTDCNAPCVGMIVNADNPKQTILVQTDWDYPGVASTFGWNIRNVQHENAPHENWDCPHKHTDGTVNCPICGVTAGEFIASAAEYLADNDGAMADDPGYFE